MHLLDARKNTEQHNFFRVVFLLELQLNIAVVNTTDEDFGRELVLCCCKFDVVANLFAEQNKAQVIIFLTMLLCSNLLVLIVFVLLAVDYEWVGGFV